MTSDELKFCPRCASPLEWRAFDDARHPACTSCEFVLWQNPKPSVEALITRGQPPDIEVLLGRRVADPAQRQWDIPGGFVNADDVLEERLLTECRREMGVEVAVKELLGVFNDEFFGEPIIEIIYRCEIVSGTPRPAGPIDDVRWFPLASPPELAFASIAAAMAALRTRSG
jgi:ADP-ribose pyrophosphatase YjhB (NUDIX family)